MRVTEGAVPGGVAVGAAVVEGRASGMAVVCTGVDAGRVVTVVGWGVEGAAVVVDEGVVEGTTVVVGEGVVEGTTVVVGGGVVEGAFVAASVVRSIVVVAG